jgi:hypothetical protein
MAHIRYSHSAPSIATSDAAWLPAGAQIGPFANKAARRTDITVVVGKDAGFGAPAAFVPALAELHVNPEVVPMGDPDKVDVHDALWRAEHSAATGAIFHEAAHAAHTRWDHKELVGHYGATPKMIDVIVTLEEPRIEANMVRTRPESRSFLRSCGMEIVGRDFHFGDTPYAAAAAAGLLLARVDAKVLSKAEAAPFRREIVAVLGEDVLARLEPLWQRFLRLHDTDYEGMVQVAREWLDVLGEDADDTEGMVGESMTSDGEGEPGEGEGEGEGSGKGESGEGEGEGSGEGSGSLDDKIKGKAREVETVADREHVTERASERSKRARAEREADGERRKAGKGPHTEAFGTGKHGYTPEGFAHLSHTRQPAAEERRAARRLASALERIDYRDRAVSKVTSALPPGRLRGRAAVQDAAARAAGRESEAELWTGKRRQRVDSTPLSIGFMVDISGSMSSAMEPLASTQWVVSTAGAHIDAKVASVHFGDKVHGVTPAGVKERGVRVFGPWDGSEAFRDGALAIDAELNLLDGRGARLLFVASDGVFVVDSDADYARSFVPLAQRKGVAVIFLDFTGHMSFGSYGAQVVNCQRMSPVEVAQVVGKAAAKELARIDGRV